MKRTILLGLLVVLGAGCSSLRFKSTEDVRELGEEQFANENYDEADIYYTELLRRDEEDLQARLRRARLRDLSGNQMAAKEDFNIALEQSPEDARARLYRAELNLRAGDLEAAETDLQALSQAGNLETYDRVAVLKFLGVVQTRKNNPSFASNYFRQATLAGAGASDPLTLRHVAEAHYNLGQCLFQMKSFGESHEQFVIYSQMAPQVGLTISPEDYYMLGVTAYLSQDFEGAQGYFEKSDPALRRRAAEILNDRTILEKAYH